jgi:hypothetical protein
MATDFKAVGFAHCVLIGGSSRNAKLSGTVQQALKGDGRDILVP